MFKRAILPILLIAVFASVPAFSGGPEIAVTHSERISVDQAAAPLKVSALEAGLPQTWCGTKSSSDQTVNSSSNDNPKFKFFYVRAADMPDRFETAANMLQKSISTIHSYLLQVSGGTRTVSIDLGTTCGPSYVDITSLTLPGSLASYLDLLGEIDKTKTMNALTLFAGSLPGPPRHYVFLLDQFEVPEYISGLGQMALDDSPGPGNGSNTPGLVAYVATPEGSLTQEINDELPRALLHEMTHTMGGVQASAPNATSAGHCTDGLDVMCYEDGSPESAGYSASICPTAGTTGLPVAYDCNNNDYFNTSPASGSYLARKWNVFNSKYLVHCVDADPYCTSVPSSSPTPDNPAARTATNNLYLYKKSKRGKKLGTVSATGAKEPGTSFVRNSVKMTSIKLPKGKWKVTLCFRESGESAVCESKTKQTSKAGYVSVPRIYVTTSRGSGTAYGSVSVKPITKSLKKKRYEVRTAKSPLKYGLDF